MITRETFDLLIYAAIVIGLILAARRLYQDLRRPLPTESTDWDLIETEIETSKKKGGNKG